MPPMLKIQGLKTYYRLRRGWVKAVDDVSFNLDHGESLGIVGESGCGKTTIALSIMQLLPSTGRIVDGQILFGGVDLSKLSQDELCKVRWKKISMIFQGAMSALDPVYRVGDQVVEALTTHDNISDEEAKTKVEGLFELVGLSPGRMNSYPHELSGGMKQRVVIAMSLACNPEMVIADEPTTALDVVVQDQILKEIKTLQEKLNFMMCYISHDISVIFETCDKIAVMYGGKILEHADAESIYKIPHHPYTIGLLKSFPSIRGEVKRLVSIPGSPPNLLNPPPGCRFEPRCPIAKEVCSREEPPPITISKEHYSSCHFALDSKLLEDVEFEEEF